MTILSLLPTQSMLGVPFTDYLNVTVPCDVGEEVVSMLLPVIESLGVMSEELPGQFRLYDSAFKATGAVFKFNKRGKVFFLSASGMALEALRRYGLYGEYLRVLSCYPHRVSMLHATQDYFVLSPPAVVLAVKDAAFEGALQLTRKHCLPKHVKVILSPDAAGSGLDTGTVYLGHRKNADVWAKVYDKRHERLQKGFADPGSIVRVEIAVQSDVGATLRDAHSPHDLFFHHAGQSLVQVPEGFSGWVSRGEGFVLPKGREVLPHDRLDRFLSFSLDVSRLVKLAVEMYGDKASDVLCRRLDRKCREAVIALDVAF